MRNVKKRILQCLVTLAFALVVAGVTSKDWLTDALAASTYGSTYVGGLL